MPAVALLIIPIVLGISAVFAYLFGWILAGVFPVNFLFSEMNLHLAILLNGYSFFFVIFCLMGIIYFFTRKTLTKKEIYYEN